jgi:hypothetical protein
LVRSRTLHIASRCRGHVVSHRWRLREMCGTSRGAANTHGGAGKSAIGQIGSSRRGSGTVLIWPSFDIATWVLFEMCGRTRQMAEACGVPTTDRAFLKMALEDITSRKRVSAKDAHVRSITGVCGRLAAAAASKIGKLTDVSAYAASGAWHASRFCCNWDKEIFHPRLSSG